MGKPITRQIQRLNQTARHDLRVARKFNATKEEVGAFVRDQLARLGYSLFERGAITLPDEDYDSDATYDDRVVQAVLSSGHPEAIQAANVLGEAVCRFIGVSEPAEIAQAQTRTGLFVTELEAGMDRYAPELRQEMDTTVRRIVEDHGPKGVLYEGMSRNAQQANDDRDAGLIDDDTWKEALRYSIEKRDDIVPEPQLPIDFNPATTPVEDLRSAIQEDAFDRNGRPPADFAREMPLDDLKTLINGPKPDSTE